MVKEVALTQLRGKCVRGIWNLEAESEQEARPRSPIRVVCPSPRAVGSCRILSSGRRHGRSCVIPQAVVWGTDWGDLGLE